MKLFSNLKHRIIKLLMRASLWWNYRNSGANVPQTDRPIDRDSLDLIKSINKSTKDPNLNEIQVEFVKNPKLPRNDILFKNGRLKMTMGDGPHKGLSLSEYLNVKSSDAKNEVEDGAKPQERGIAHGN